MSVKNVFSPLDIASVVTETINSATSYLKAKEVEETERQRLISCLNAITLKIELERDKFEKFMEKSFAERERLYSSADKVLEKGLQENNMQLVTLASNLMMNVYNKNPLDGLDNKMQDVKLEGLQPIKSYID
ncbi:hypothetical protein AABM38_22410 [Heyndrickxia sp. MSNUG]|uniref:hypothetical protein n=1 Tax=Heyndrickxia sp. MSNUG TaxID=3136677 RepID=UPI003C2EE3AD